MLTDHRFDATQKAREWVATLNPLDPGHQGSMLEEPLPPRYPVEDLLSIVNADIRKPFDMREVLLRIVDDSRLSIFKPGYGVNMLTAWADIIGKPTKYSFQTEYLCSLSLTTILMKVFGLALLRIRRL